MAQQAVGVLVGAALPRGVRVAEADPHVQARADLLVQGEFRTLVPGRRVAQEPGQVPHLADDGLLDLACVVPVGQVQQDREPGGAFDQGADGAPVRRTGDQITLPMAGDGPVLDLGGPVRDHDHGIPEPGSATRAATGFALGAALAHGPFQLGFQLALALDVDGLVDRLDACVHVLIIGEVMPEPVADLLGTPMPSKAGEYLPPQARARPGFPGPGAFDVYGQINVYGVTTKSERYKRSYWTRTAAGNGIGGRKAPVPYGS